MLHSEIAQGPQLLRLDIVDVEVGLVPVGRVELQVDLAPVRGDDGTRLGGEHAQGRAEVPPGGLVVPYVDVGVVFRPWNDDVVLFLKNVTVK